MTDQIPYWVGLSIVPGIGPARMRALLDHFGNAQSTYSALYGDLIGAGLDSRTAEAVLSTRRKLDLDAEMEKLDRARVEALTWENEDYPKRLLEVNDAPPVLYTMGRIEDADSWAIGVVGTR